MFLRALPFVFSLLGAATSAGVPSNPPDERNIHIPKCSSLQDPQEEDSSASSSYCKCMSAFVNPAKATVSIKCDFKNTEDVMLTEDLYPFRNSSLGSAYVRIVNASRVHVTRQFLKELMQAPSIALDVWRAGTLILDSMPEPESMTNFKNYKTFVGVGIVSCYVPEVPPYFLRDRTRGGLRIKSSHVGSFRQGVLHNIEEMRYLVIEDSRVDFFEGSVATEGFVTLSKRQLHAWNGLVISNVTIDSISSGAFNITHKSDMETTELMDSTIGSLNTRALVISGDIDVTIQKNVFRRMETEAIQVAVSGDVIFDKNDIANWEPDALEGLICHKRTSLEENTFRVEDLTNIAMNISSTPFHTTCGNPQLFLVIRQQRPLSVYVNSVPPWILGTILFVILVGVLVAIAYSHQRQNLMMHFYRGRGRLPPSWLRERKLSQENLPNGAEIDHSANVTDDGLSNPVYVDVKESSS